MKRFVLLSVGFEKPTPDVMAAWQAWFATIQSHVVEMAGLRNGREISRAGTRDLPMDLAALTGFVIIEADDLALAERLAQTNPYVSSIRIYEAASH